MEGGKPVGLLCRAGGGVLSMRQQCKQDTQVQSKSTAVSASEVGRLKRGKVGLEELLVHSVEPPLQARNEVADPALRQVRKPHFDSGGHTLWPWPQAGDVRLLQGPANPS